jgi:hypothetical protein
VTCYRMSRSGVQSSIGRARGRRMVPVFGPATVPAPGPLEPVLGFSESSGTEKVKLSLSTPLR